MTKGVDVSFDDSVLWWFIYVEITENDSIAEGEYVGKCPESCSVGQTLMS